MPGLSVKIIVGLGNPGSAYARTRHNAGFWFADELARRHGGTFRMESKHRAELARVRIAEQEIWLAKPMSFMNLSGGPVTSVAGFYKAAPGELLVAHDELDLEPGDVRLKHAGGHGGHNGLRDIIANIGAEFWRVRIGVGHPGEKHDVVNYLTRASAADDALIHEAVNAAADIVPLLLTDGAQKAMHRLHSPPHPPSAPSPPSPGEREG
ncbi:MAG: aminoacyl-tRNA hydrolase [Steroidobacteraceae bacterium]